MAVSDQIKSLSQQLFPTGRAFWMKPGGELDKLISGVNASEARAWADAIAIKDSALPDNANFTADDASAWETRLGLISNSLVSLADRELAIIRKMNHPGTIPARQNYLYLQGQLQEVGFNVYVYENIFPSGYDFVTKTPKDFSLLPFPLGAVYHGQINHGQVNHGGGIWGNKIANSIYESNDNSFVIGTNYRSTFFIGGATPGSWATVDVNRKLEFRQLVLKIKPVQTVAFVLCSFY